MDPERQVAQLGEGCQGLFCCPIQAASDGRVTTVTQRASRDLQLEAERDESLLGAVMEVSLDPPALEIPGLDDPCARGADLLELRFDLGRQSIVLDRQPHGAGDRGDQARLLEEDGVVDDRGLPDAVPLEHRDGLARAVFGQLHRLAGRIDEPILAGRPVGHLQRGITERVGEGIAEAGRRRGLPQLDDEVRDARRGPSGTGASRTGPRSGSRSGPGRSGCPTARAVSRTRGRSMTPTAGGSRRRPRGRASSGAEPGRSIAASADRAR